LSRPRCSVNAVNILIIEDDPASQAALRQVLDGEEWRVQIVPEANSALQVLAAGDWMLAIVNVGMTGLGGSLYTTLRELALAPAIEEGKGRVRVLFLVPEAGAEAIQPALEREHLPYALKPFNLNDVLEKVSDLLLEAGAIPQSIRQVRREGLAVGKRREARTTASRLGGARNTGMFANRSDYSSTTEEEIADYERQQQEQQQVEAQRKKKTRDNLGG
jgi:DNA-binding response OmpR family regulator